MAKAARKTITPKKTGIASDEVPMMMKAPGCHWEFWNGAIGLSTDLCVFEAGDGVGEASDLPNSERIALANYMIDLWTRFGGLDRDQGADAEQLARRDALARQYLDAEADIRDLCRAVKVVSSVITDQLADPLSSPPVTSDYGLEVETFKLDAEMIRFAVDHAASIALTVSHKMS